MKGHHTGRAVIMCPACSSERFETIGGAALGFHCDDALGIEHPSYQVRECNNCGLHYKSHVLTSESLGSYYGNLDFTPFKGDYGFPTDAALLNRLRRLPPGGRLLDFGCSTGRLLAALGSGYERFGVEINEDAADEARRQGITILAERDLDDGEAGTFDGIVLSDVYEHLVEPTKTLSRLARRLAPGGRLFLVTGLADAVRPRALIAEHWYFRIGGHLHMLSRRHLDWLGRTLGLEIDSVEIMSHYKRNTKHLARQRLQAALYRSVKLEPDSTMAGVLRKMPGLRRAARWTNMPTTEQLMDHAVAELHKR